MKSKIKQSLTRFTAAVIINLLLLGQIATAENNTSTLAPQVTLQASSLKQLILRTTQSANVWQNLTSNLNDENFLPKDLSDSLPEDISLIVSKKGNNALAGYIAREKNISTEEIVVIKHKDGESRPVVLHPGNILGQDCLIAHRLANDSKETDEDTEFADLLFLIGGLRDFKAKSITCLLPESLFERSPALLEVLGTITDKIYLTNDNNFKSPIKARMKTSIVSLPKLDPVKPTPKGKKAHIDAVLFTRARAELHKKVADIIQTYVLTGRIDLRTLKSGRDTAVEFPNRGIKNKRSLLFHTTKTNRGLVQLLLALYELYKAGAKEIVTFLGYMGYARGHENYLAPDFGPQAQIVNCAKVILELISNFSNRLVIVNAHFLKSTDENRFFYLKNPHNFTREPKQEDLAYLESLKIDNLNGIDLLARHCIRNFKAKNPVLVAPDAGIYPFVKDAAAKLGLDSGYIEKRREFGEVFRDNEEVIDELGEHMDLEGRSVIILDDIIAGGSTTISAAKICKRLGARRIFAGAVHGIFAKGNKEFDHEIEGLIEGVLSTDSIITEYSVVSLAQLIVSYLGLEAQSGEETGEIIRRRDPAIKSPYDVIKDLDLSANYWWHILREDETARREMEDRLHLLIDRHQFTEKILKWISEEGFEAEKIIVMGDYLVRRKIGTADDLDVLAVVKTPKMIKEDVTLDFAPLPKVSLAIRSEGFFKHNEVAKKRVDVWIPTGGIEIYNKRQSIGIKPEFIAIIERAEELISAGSKRLELARTGFTTTDTAWWRYFEAYLALNYLVDKLLSSDNVFRLQFKQFYSESIEHFYITHFMGKKGLPFSRHTSEALGWLERFDSLLRNTKNYLLNTLEKNKLDELSPIGDKQVSYKLKSEYVKFINSAI